MSVVTVRPNTDIADGDSSRTGGASNHAVLADNSDSSYVTLEDLDAMKVGFPTASIPAGSRVFGLALRARLEGSIHPGTGQVFTVIVDNDGNVKAATSNVTWINPTTISLVAMFTDDRTTPEAWIGCSTPSIDVKLYELYCDVRYIAPPEVSADAPSGTITDTNFPTVSWTPDLDVLGGPQTAYQVKVFNDAQYGAGGFDPDISTPAAASGIVTGTHTSWDTDPLLPNDTYRAYVRVAQTFGGDLWWSDWDFVGFVENVPSPDPPASVDITAQDDLARLVLDVIADNGGAVDTDYFEVQRSSDGGVTWAALRTTSDTGFLVPDPASAQGIDTEAPNGVEVTYRVRALHDFGGGSMSASGWVEASGEWSSARWWIKHPTRPDLSMAIDLASFASKTRAARKGTFDVRQRSDPIVVTDTVRSSVQGTIAFNLYTDAERAALDVIVDANLPVLLQGPPGHHEPDRWVSLGDEERTRFADKAFVEGEVGTYPFTEVARPLGAMEFVASLFPADDLYPGSDVFPGP